MSSARMVRGTKSRFFIYVCGVLAFGLMVYLFHGSQLQLDDSRKALATCTQQTESLSAQLQVIFEYKLRLEKSLQKEKAEHKQTKDECQSKAKQNKDDRERELVEAANKYSALQQSTRLLQSKQKDLEDEINDLRKKNLNLLEKMEIQKKQLTAKLTEEQQLRLSKEKAVENVKTRNLELEVKYNKLIEDYNSLKKDKFPETNGMMALEKTKLQLERELEAVKTKLEDCLGGDRHSTDRKVSQGVGDHPSGVEPPKILQNSKPGTNTSTTPVINPEAVIDHDVPSPKPSLKSTKTLSENKGTVKKSTESAAAPLEIPKQQDNEIEMEINRQIPMPNNPEPPQQSPENTVIKKPEYSDAAKKKDEDENQGGEVGQVIARPMNPIQEPQFQKVDRAANKEAEVVKHKSLAIPWDEEGPQNNGAHEEGEEEVAPIPHHNWRIQGDDGENKVLPRRMNPDYPGGGVDYDKDNQEEEEDEEGEQMDYLGNDGVPKQHKMARFRQFDRNTGGGGGGGGIMLNPK